MKIAKDTPLQTKLQMAERMLARALARYPADARLNRSMSLERYTEVLYAKYWEFCLEV